MKPSEQRPSEVCHQQTEAIVARHVDKLFKRLPMLSGFWLRPDLEVTELSVCAWPGYTAGSDLYDQVTESLVRARRGMSRGGAAHSRAHLCTRGALMRPKTLTVCAVITVDAPRREVGCTLPRPVHATAEEVRCADELRLQLRARLLRDAAPQTQPWCVGADRYERNKRAR